MNTRNVNLEKDNDELVKKFNKLDIDRENSMIFSLIFRRKNYVMNDIKWPDDKNCFKFLSK